MILGIILNLANISVTLSYSLVSGYALSGWISTLACIIPPDTTIF